MWVDSERLAVTSHIASSAAEPIWSWCNLASGGHNPCCRANPKSDQVPSLCSISGRSQVFPETRTRRPDLKLGPSGVDMDWSSTTSGLRKEVYSTIL